MRWKQRIWRWLLITAGAAVAAFGIGSFLAPNGAMIGGVSGVATVINRVTGFPVGAAAFLMNVPIFLTGICMLGRGIGASTIYASFAFSALIDLFGRFVWTDDVFLAAVFGGILTGIGFGLVFLNGSTTGGMDIVAKIIKKHQSHLPLGRIIFAVDLITIGISMLVFHNMNVGLYSIIALGISTYVMDLLLQGLHFAALVLVVSDRANEISAAIHRRLERGVTILDGYGAYSRLPKGVVLCSVRQRQIPLMKELVRSCDAGAFMIVTDAREVLGQGFQSLSVGRQM